jgi:hypothetical protein
MRSCAQRRVPKAPGEMLGLEHIGALCEARRGARSKNAYQYGIESGGDDDGGAGSEQQRDHAVGGANGGSDAGKRGKSQGEARQEEGQGHAGESKGGGEELQGGHSGLLRFRVFLVGKHKVEDCSGSGLECRNGGRCVGERYKVVKRLQRERAGAAHRFWGRMEKFSP